MVVLSLLNLLIILANTIKADSHPWDQKCRDIDDIGVYSIHLVPFMNTHDSNQGQCCTTILLYEEIYFIY